ncbi:DUF2330 domain-containing protein [Streptomyces sp. NPDC000410]|uniref:DUF2330 domain-containing protein n=1 Tax=Streptomyces sp. NPDC000410 TaxID=3154254 RepID=UPI003327EEBC
MRGIHKILLVVGALFALQLGSLIAPAYACGCGAMIPDGKSRIQVDHETSIVSWDGRREDIVMRFTVNGDAPSAAWIMPVPNRATVELGDEELFRELSYDTEPEERTRHYFWPRGGDWPFSSGDGSSAGAAPPGDGAQAAPPVGVVGRERLGAFDVARLTATDPDALRNWLEENGFEFPDRLGPELRPYVDQKWEYVAIRLAPDDENTVLGGSLDPLRIRFASERLVYPMRLSRLAKNPQSLTLYVLAPHRMEPKSRIGGDEPEVTFAGELTYPRPAVGKLTGGKPVFLTAFEQEFPEPSRIDGDHELLAAAADTPYRQVEWRDEILLVGGMPVWLLTVGGVVVVVTAGILWRRSRKHAVRFGHVIE